MTIVNPQMRLEGEASVHMEVEDALRFSVSEMVCGSTLLRLPEEEVVAGPHQVRVAALKAFLVARGEAQEFILAEKLILQAEVTLEVVVSATVATAMHSMDAAEGEEVIAEVSQA
jgi:hypothetical protein